MGMVTAIILSRSNKPNPAAIAIQVLDSALLLYIPHCIIYCIIPGTVYYVDAV
jgi:hypothetical protein